MRESYARLAGNTSGDDDDLGALEGRLETVVGREGANGLGRRGDVGDVGGDAGRVDDIKETELGAAGEQMQARRATTRAPTSDTSGLIFSSWAASAGAAAGARWVQMPGSFKQVSVGSRKHVWGVDSKDCIYKWKKGTWQRVTVADVPQHISAAADGSIVALDKDLAAATGAVSLRRLDVPKA